MDLPLLSAFFVAFALTLYVILDGFDLGVGILLLFQPALASRDHMIDSITPTWDGNETWIIMAGVTLLNISDSVFGLLPAFYLPVILMLSAGISRRLLRIVCSRTDIAMPGTSHLQSAAGRCVHGEPSCGLV
jgi:cytochrome bd-type quinol oxidase subunit 2